MHTPLTEEQKELITQKESFIAQKATLLKEYKSYQNDLEYAADNFEESLIENKREKLATQIRTLGQQIREIESWESQA
ncbi:hypothetical protein [Sulfurovum mangrovi]|uniref:hypothetical protein n=1 Tax=Sulfurovum mangrovi TaxID=2893889 RepID=UPI001E392EF0|nr:hypothetical protein [Sulfurovum mangrovi]UFH58090.1 hypothetical protein LN246_06970 [Sulfurovum mangrovi]